MAGFGSLAYVLGKISYIVGQNCMDIFLEQVGTGEQATVQDEYMNGSLSKDSLVGN